MLKRDCSNKPDRYILYLFHLLFFLHLTTFVSLTCRVISLPFCIWSTVHHNALFVTIRAFTEISLPHQTFISSFASVLQPPFRKNWERSTTCKNRTYHRLKHIQRLKEKDFHCRGLSLYHKDIAIPGC